MPLMLNAGEPVMEYARHEGHRAMENVLSGARPDEEAVWKG
jgi:hypothetical protein